MTLIANPWRFLSLVLVLLSLTSPLQAVEIIAHRGASHDAPENTMASVSLGWEQGADANEIDIYLAKDGRIAVLHDATTERTTGHAGKVMEMTLAELRALDAGSWKGDPWKGEKIPTMEEIVASIPAGKRLFIELKGGPEVLPELQRVLAASGKAPEQLAIIGFKFATMVEARKLFPNLRLYWLSSYSEDKQTGELPNLDALIAKAVAAKFDGLNLNFKFPLDAAQVAKVKAAGLGLYIWTVNDAAVAQTLTAAGVDGITTDRPGWLREQLAR